MNSNWQRVGAGIILAIMIVAISPAQAAIAIINLNLQADLQSDGTVAVSERLELSGVSKLDWTVYSKVSQPEFLADGQLIPASSIKISASGSGWKLTSKKATARIWQINYVTTSNLIRHNDRDQFFFKVFQSPLVSIGRIAAKFNLPKAVDKNSLTGNVYAIGGVVGATQTVESGRQISYTADFAAPNGLMTINASWPKSILQLSSSQELKLTLSNLDVLPWIVLGIALPLTTLFVLVWLLIRQRRIDKLVVVNKLTELPSNLSPLIVGVLVNKKIYPEEIVAMLIDLCQRGYLVIIKKNHEYFLGKRRLPDEHLQSWEKDILETILPAKEIKTTDRELHRVNKQSLFNPDVRTAFEVVYQVITQNNYFRENPHITRIRYKLVGLIFYFIGVGGLIWTAISSANAFLIIPLAGTIVLSWLILRLTNRLISYSATGNEERIKWLAFANFLSDNVPLDHNLFRDQTFERYLPYAIVLHQTKVWVNRFEHASTVIVRPDWFVTYDDLSTAEFASGLTDFIGKISKILASMRGPLVN